MNLVESLTRKQVIRKGQMKIKYKTDRDGYKVKIDKRTGAVIEVKMSPTEIRNRMKSARKAARKRKIKSAQIARNRAKSMKKRINWK